MSHFVPSPDPSAEITDILARTKSTVRRAELALDSFPDTPSRERAVAAMHNAVVMGRAVTNVLQNLRSKVQGFDDWYEPWRVEMSQDPLLRYLYKLRSKILKEGQESVSMTVTIQYATSEDISRMLGSAPPNTIGYFLCDTNGGNGWVVRLEDGTIEKVYVTLPDNSNVRSGLAFDGPPGEHLGDPIEDHSLENICRLYVQYLRRLVQAAEKRFAPSNSR